MLQEILFILTTTIIYAGPLILVTTGAMVTEKAGVINIGLEGLLTLAAFFSSAIALKTQSINLAFFYTLIIISFFLTLLGLFYIKFKANQIIASLSLNFIGPALSLFLCKIFFDGSSMTPPVSDSLKLPAVMGLYPTILVGIVAIALLHYLLNKTAIGLSIIATGENPEAAKSSGVKTNQIKFFALLVSGLFYTLAGMTLSLGIVSSFRATLVSGQGYMALALVIFSQWDFKKIIPASLLFGATQALIIFLGGLDIEKFQVANIPSQILSTFPYLLTLIVLIVLNKKSSAPLSLGKI